MLKIRLSQDSGTNPEWPFFSSRSCSGLLWEKLRYLVWKFSANMRENGKDKSEAKERLIKPRHTQDVLMRPPFTPALYLKQHQIIFFMWFQSWSIHPELLISSRLITAGNIFFLQNLSQAPHKQYFLLWFPDEIHSDHFDFSWDSSHFSHCLTSAWAAASERRRLNSIQLGWVNLIVCLIRRFVWGIQVDSGTTVSMQRHVGINETRI